MRFLTFVYLILTAGAAAGPTSQANDCVPHPLGGQVCAGDRVALIDRKIYARDKVTGKILDPRPLDEIRIQILGTVTATHADGTVDIQYEPSGHTGKSKSLEQVLRTQPCDGDYCQGATVEVRYSKDYDCHGQIDAVTEVGTLQIDLSGVCSAKLDGYRTLNLKDALASGIVTLQTPAGQSYPLPDKETTCEKKFVGAYRHEFQSTISYDQYLDPTAYPTKTERWSELGGGMLGAAVGRKYGSDHGGGWKSWGGSVAGSVLGSAITFGAYHGVEKLRDFPKNRRMSRLEPLLEAIQDAERGELGGRKMAELEEKLDHKRSAADIALKVQAMNRNGVLCTPALMDEGALLDALR